MTAEADGSFTVRIAAADIGTGARTALTLIAADALETVPERVRVRIGDSDFGPAMIAGGSMGTRSWAWAITAAAAELRERLAVTRTVPPEGITVRSDTTEALRALAQKERHSFGAQVAEVAVDVDTGEVRVLRMLGIFAAGRIVNPLTARNQLVGGMTWGISMALHEEAVRDRNAGRHYAPDLAGYHVATHADVSAVEADWVDDHDPDDPVGIKGVGEIGIVGAAAAVAMRCGTPPAYATGICRSAPTGSSPRRRRRRRRRRTGRARARPRRRRIGRCLTLPTSCTAGWRRRFAVAAVVSVGGSAPRGPGAALAVDGEGDRLRGSAAAVKARSASWAPRPSRTAGPCANVLATATRTLSPSA
ncbi:hypothetical protein SMICM304S_01083 [Streptomyces microflavus]